MASNRVAKKRGPGGRGGRLGRLAAVALLVVLAGLLPARTASSAPSTSPGQLYAFGYNFSGQLGNEANVKTNTPNPIPTLVTLPAASGPVTQAAAGGVFSLALTATGQLYGFGGNGLGELGRTPTEEVNPTPALVTLPGAGGPVAQFAAGASHSLVVTSTGQLYAFGSNDVGQIARELNPVEPFEPHPTPTLVALPGATGPVVQATAGWEYSFALTSTGQLYGFGGDAYGQMGTGTVKESRITPTIVSLPTGSGQVTAVAAGFHHSLILTSTGQVYAAGENGFGQLGSGEHVGTPTPNPTPALVTMPGATGPAAQVAVGANFALVLTSTGQLYAFGENKYGQLGRAENTGTETANPTPTLVTLPGAAGRPTEIAAGSYHSSVVTASGQLYSFGDNRWGALGSETNAGTVMPNPTPTPVSFPGGATIEFVARGQTFHTLAVIAGLAVSASSLPAGQRGVPYSAQVQATGGSLPYSFAAAGLPPGLAINSASGVIAGTPTAAGSYSPTVTVTDSHGIVASAPVAIGIGAPVVPPLSLRPRISAATQSSKRWREGKRLARISRKLPLGTTFSFALNERASVSFRFTQTANGRKVGRRCVAQTKGNRHRRSCKRTAAAGVLAFNGHAGTNKVAFQGRISSKKALKPGSYTLVITATDSAGARSAPASLSFTIVR